MRIFLILLPYGAFTGLMLVTSAALSLFAAAGICVAVVAYDMLGGRSIKLLGAGSALLFAAVGGYVTLVDSSLSNPVIKLAIDAGVFAISAMSLAIGRPFTRQYALEIVDTETANQPGFLKANYIITSVWTLAFLMMMIANVLMVYVPNLPLWSGLAIAFGARNSAAYFSKWYPQYRRAKYGPPAATALSGS